MASLFTIYGTALNAIPTLKERDALTKPASPIAGAAVTGVAVYAGRLLSSPALPSDKVD